MLFRRILLELSSCAVAFVATCVAIGTVIETWVPAAYGASELRLRPRDLLEAPPPSPPLLWTPAGTFLGMRDEDTLARLRALSIRRIQINVGGSTLSLKLVFTDGSAAAFKPQQIWPQSIPRKEIAAFRIDRALGLGAVPPAAARVLRAAEIFAKLDPAQLPLADRIRTEGRFRPDDSLAGTASYWIPTIVELPLHKTIDEWSRWLKFDEPIPDPSLGVAAQISSMIVFDYLINNHDRFSGANTLADEHGERLFFMDNTMSFHSAADAHPDCQRDLARVERFSRRLVASLEHLDETALREALAGEPDPPFPLLFEDEIQGVLGRRDRVLARIDELRLREGDERVLVFP